MPTNTAMALKSWSPSDPGLLSINNGGEAPPWKKNTNPTHRLPIRAPSQLHANSQAPPTDHATPSTPERRRLTATHHRPSRRDAAPPARSTPSRRDLRALPPSTQRRGAHRQRHQR